jgi:hypothetical protein
VRRVVLKSAELRDGLYVKPFALLEVEQLWVGRREVWTSTHGRAARYHVMIDGGVAACRKKQNWRNRSVILLNEDSLIPIVDVPAHMCCLRNGCRQIFEAMIQ